MSRPAFAVMLGPMTFFFHTCIDAAIPPPPRMLPQHNACVAPQPASAVDNTVTVWQICVACVFLMWVKRLQEEMVAEQAGGDVKKNNNSDRTLFLLHTTFLFVLLCFVHRRR